MNRITAGKVFTAARQRSGSGSKGKWELLVTQDEQGSNDITIFVGNMPSNVREGGQFRIERIISVSSAKRQDGEGKWYTNITVNADVSPVETHEEFIAKTAGQSWEEVPDEARLPF